MLASIVWECTVRSKFLKDIGLALVPINGIGKNELTVLNEFVTDEDTNEPSEALRKGWVKPKCEIFLVFLPDNFLNNRILDTPDQGNFEQLIARRRRVLSGCQISTQRCDKEKNNASNRATKPH